MLTWITENIGTMVIGLAILLVVVLAARSVYRNKKNGGCSCSCGGCSGGASCHGGAEHIE